jgi:NAD(P)-dependent dehydrogenase (short-subunit alcohol dehydrogenase family)
MSNKVAIITGASQGLGATLAQFLSGQHYNLILTARRSGPLHDFAESLRTNGSKIVAISGDVGDLAHRRMVAEVAQSFGRLDLLVNNASTLGVSPLPTLDKYPLDELRLAFELNVLSPLALTQEMLPLLISSEGLIVNISSDAAVGGYPGWGGYGASKAALDLLTLTLANELEETGVGAVSVDPGDMRTQMHQDAFPGEDISDRPLPDVTLPFWAWLLGQSPQAVSGMRYQAQSDRWEVKNETD